jgi:isopentenyl diphosphate isomerase/L-lactate dehydrogenase-like FMN-dependent dehydrogenase
MTVKELIAKLQTMPQDLPVTADGASLATITNAELIVKAISDQRDVAGKCVYLYTARG